MEWSKYGRSRGIHGYQCQFFLYFYDYLQDSVVFWVSPNYIEISRLSWVSMQRTLPYISSQGTWNSYSYLGYIGSTGPSNHWTNSPCNCRMNQALIILCGATDLCFSYCAVQYYPFYQDFHNNLGDLAWASVQQYSSCILSGARDQPSYWNPGYPNKGSAGEIRSRLEPGNS